MPLADSFFGDLDPIVVVLIILAIVALALYIVNHFRA